MQGSQSTDLCIKKDAEPLPFELRRDFYKSFHSTTLKLLFRNVTLLQQDSADKLKMVIKRALRFVFKDKSSSHEELCRRIGLSSLLEQRLAKILSIVFKILASDAGPESLRDLIALRRSTYNLRGTTDNTGPSKVKSTTFGLRSWKYAASNTIPDEFRKIQTYTAFKNNIK